MKAISKEKLVKIIKNRQWMIQGFNGLPLYLHTVANNTGWMIKPMVGVNYFHFFLRSHGSRAKYYYDEKDLTAIGNGYYKRIKTLPQLKKFIRGHREGYEHARAEVKRFPKNLKALDLPELIEMLQKIMRELTMAIGVTHAIEGISFVSEQKIHHLLDKRNLNNSDNYQLLCAPAKASFLSIAQNELYQINRAKNKAKLVQKFLRDFGWIDNSYVKAKVLTAADILKKARLQQNAPSLRDLRKTKIKKNRFIKSLKLSWEEAFVVQTVETCTNWQDDRKKFLLTTISWLEEAVTELAKRVNLPIEVFKYMYSQEVTFQNLTSKKFLAQIKKRYPQADYYAAGDGIHVYDGRDVEYIEKELNKVGHRETTEIKGMVACNGKITGRVRLCRSIHDIPKVKRGEILVTSMTRPEFLPAMQKAAAFITDEGGVTSHAAIVSREMNKPCIIGTKHATEVLRDGELVEVDANKGTVRKI